jgi:ABC-type Fe3+/spermidine/putrescine transport system ATPase subunit
LSIKINELCFTYEDFKLHISLKVEKGELLSILGPSGSGKTTLLRLIAGFIEPSGGSIIFEGGRNISGVPTADRNIGMVFQDYALFPHMDVFHNIAYGLQTRHTGRALIKSRVMRLLELVKLEGYGKRKVGELSGGEKQRVALARAMAPEPELLLFDEPLSALDVKLRKELRREISRVQRETGVTTIYVTHDQEEAMSISDRIAVMDKGIIREIGTPEKLYNSPDDIFTAEFVGTMNLVTVTIDGKEKRVAFRPEASTAAEDGECAALVCENIRIVSCEYRGGYYSCEGISDKDEVIVFYSPIRHSEGAEVRVKIDEKQIIMRF